jgi:hypothetical protein
MMWRQETRGPFGGYYYGKWHGLLLFALLIFFLYLGINEVESVCSEII